MSPFFTPLYSLLPHRSSFTTSTIYVLQLCDIEMICFHSCVTEWPHYILEVESIWPGTELRPGISAPPEFTGSRPGTVQAQEPFLSKRTRPKTEWGGRNYQKERKSLSENQLDGKLIPNQLSNLGMLNCSMIC